jgi:hypothetical protein
MLGIIKAVRRTLEGFVIAFLLIALMGALGASETLNALLADGGAAAMVFLVVIALVLADLIGKFISILSSTFPDLIPDLGEDDLKRASLIQRLRPFQTVALLSGAHAARLVMFLLLFALLGGSYALAPPAVQATLFGDFTVLEAIEIFLREGLAGSVGYFLFFLGPDDLQRVTGLLIDRPLTAASVNGDIFLVGVRLYGLAFVLALLRTLATPVTYLRARRRAVKLPAPAGQVPATG